MIDRLLGRARLKERIAELEEEVEGLEGQLEGESERRREAVAARNEAEAEINRLEDRVTELEDRVERAEAGDATDRDYRVTETLRGERLDRVLRRLDTVEAGEEGALTAMVTDEHDLSDAVVEAVGERAPLVERAAPCLLYADDAGVVACTLAPPFAPDAFAEWADGFRLERDWFVPTGRYAVALVRADLFAVGVYEGDERVAYRGFESDVKGTHSKGGFSQGRFERRRESQITEHLDDAREALDALDYDVLSVVGEKTLLDEFDGADATLPSDATGSPREALDAAVHDLRGVPYHAI